jgi:hypothetical protein
MTDNAPHLMHLGKLPPPSRWPEPVLSLRVMFIWLCATTAAAELGPRWLWLATCYGNWLICHDCRTHITRPIAIYGRDGTMCCPQCWAQRLREGGNPWERERMVGPMRAGTRCSVPTPETSIGVAGPACSRC